MEKSAFENNLRLASIIKKDRERIALKPLRTLDKKVQIIFL